jgi:hypothetical protein
MDKKKIIIISIVVLVIILIIVLIIASKKKKDNQTKEAESTKSPDTFTKIADSAGIYKNESWPLKVYMKGPNVERLQKVLISKGANISNDGYFGLKTESALLNIFNTKEVSEQTLKSWESGNTGVTGGKSPSIDTSTEEGIDSFITKLYEDLILTNYNFSSRDEESADGIYKQLSLKPNDVFVDIFESYRKRFPGNYLDKDIDDAKFSIYTNVDSAILSRAEGLGLKLV